MELFGVDEATMRKVMDAALSRGGDYCDLYFQQNIANWVGLQDDAVNRAYSNVGFGVGIRVLKGDQTGFSYTEEISEKAMLKAAATAATIAGGGIGAQSVALNFTETADYYPSDRLWEDVSIESKVPFIQELNQRLHDKDSRIVKAHLVRRRKLPCHDRQFRRAVGVRLPAHGPDFGELHRRTRWEAGRVFLLTGSPERRKPLQHQEYGGGG
jgi:hypothetical protein